MDRPSYLVVMNPLNGTWPLKIKKEKGRVKMTDEKNIKEPHESDNEENWRPFARFYVPGIGLVETQKLNGMTRTIVIQSRR